MLMKEFTWPKGKKANKLSPQPQLEGIISSIHEEDFTVPIKEVKVNADLTVNTSVGDFSAQKLFMTTLSKWLKYPVANLKSPLTTERVASDLNQIIQDAGEIENVVIRTQDNLLHAVYPIFSAPHIPPYTKDTYNIIKEYSERLHGLYGSIDLFGDLKEGQLTVSLLMKDFNLAEEGDPSYAAAYFRSITEGGFPGIQLGYHLQRTACANSSIFYADKGWKTATRSADLSETSYRMKLSEIERGIPALFNTYKSMKETKIETIESFRHWRDVIRTYLGRKTDVTLQKWLQVDPITAALYYDPEFAKTNERDNLYVMFNDVTYYARLNNLDEDHLDRAEAAAGALFKTLFNEELALLAA